MNGIDASSDGLGIVERKRCGRIAAASLGIVLALSLSSNAGAQTRQTFLCQNSTTGDTKAAASTALNASQLTALLSDLDKKLSATGTRVVGSGPDLTVLAETDSKTSDRDLKIDAVFIAKTLMDGAPNQVERVQVIFSQKGNNGKFLSISKKEISDYGAGKIPAETFLSSLRLNQVQAEELPQVAAGPLVERRLLAVQRIEKLRKQGTGVKPYEAMFQEVEKSVGSTDLEQKLSHLEDKLKTQEELVADARKSLRGGGIQQPKGYARPADAQANATSGSLVDLYRKNPKRADEAGFDVLNRISNLIEAKRAQNPADASNLLEMKNKVMQAHKSGNNEEKFRQLDDLKRRFPELDGTVFRAAVDKLGEKRPFAQGGQQVGQGGFGQGGFGGQGGFNNRPNFDKRFPGDKQGFRKPPAPWGELTR